MSRDQFDSRGRPLAPRTCSLCGDTATLRGYRIMPPERPPSYWTFSCGMHGESGPWEPLDAEEEVCAKRQTPLSDAHRPLVGCTVCGRGAICLQALRSATAALPPVPSLARVVELVDAGPERIREIIFVHHPDGEWSARARVDYVRVGEVAEGATPEAALGALIVKLEAHARRTS